MMQFQMKEIEPAAASVIGKDSVGASELNGSTGFFAFILQTPVMRGALPYVLQSSAEWLHCSDHLG